MVTRYELKDKCAACGKRAVLTDGETGEIVCSICGFVLSEHSESSFERHFPDDGIDKRRTGDRTSLSRHDKGLATIINPMNRDSTGKALSPSMKIALKRLRTWDSRSQSTQTDRNFKDAFNELYKMKDKLALSDAIIEKTAYIYRKAMEKKLVKGRSISGMIAACLYAACRDLGTPRTLKDVSQMANIKRKDLATCYRMIVKEFDLKMPVVDCVQCIARIANDANITEKTKRDAIRIIDIVKIKNIVAGKNPMGLAATALYLACLQNGEAKSQKDIAQAANVTEVTLRNQVRGFKLHGI